MPRYKIIFEVIYTTDAESYEEAASKAFGDVQNGLIHCCDIKELSYGTNSCN